MWSVEYSIYYRWVSGKLTKREAVQLLFERHTSLAEIYILRIRYY